MHTLSARSALPPAIFVLEPIRKWDNRLQIRPFGQIFRFFSLNSPLFALKNRKISLKMANFRFDSPSSYRLLPSAEKPRAAMPVYIQWCGLSGHRLQPYGLTRQKRFADWLAGKDGLQ